MLIVQVILTGLLRRSRHEKKGSWYVDEGEGEGEGEGTLIFLLGAVVRGQALRPLSCSA